MISVVTASGIADGEVGGNCPVQGGGRVGPLFGLDAQHWYFRARWDRWTLDVGPDEGDLLGMYVDEDRAVWRAEGRWGSEGDAGWMPYAVAEAIIVEALTRYLAGEPAWKAPDDLAISGQ